jgi:hypothetical protein
MASARLAAGESFARGLRMGFAIDVMGWMFALRDERDELGTVYRGFC